MRRDEKSENMKDESQNDNDLEINIMSENFEHEKSNLNRNNKRKWEDISLVWNKVRNVFKRKEKKANVEKNEKSKGRGMEGRKLKTDCKLR